MTSDGAHLGVGAGDALKAVLGGEQPAKVETVMEMRARLLNASLRPRSYDGMATAAARLVLEFMERHPETTDMPADSEGEFGKKADGSLDYEHYRVVREGLYDYMKRAEPDWFALHSDRIWSELTGFMWGWAVNAARRCIELPPVANPALFEIR